MQRLRVVVAGMVVALIAGALASGAVAQGEGDDPAGERSDSTSEVATVGNLVYATGRSPEDATELPLIHFRPSTVSKDTPMVIDVGATAVDPMELVERGVSVFSLLFFPDRWSEFAMDGDPEALRTMAEAVACAVRFARGSEYGSETAPLVLIGFSSRAVLPAHVALAGESYDRVWGDYEAAGGPPAEWDCVVDDASTRVDGYVGIGGAYDTVWGSEFPGKHDPDLWEMLRGTVGLHPELRLRLLHGDADVRRPLEVSVAFETVLAKAGYDVEVVVFAGGHTAPHDLIAETVVEVAS